MYNARLLREILDAQLEMVCRFTRDGTILFVNRAYAVTLDTSPEQLTGRSLWDFVTAEDRAHVEEQMTQLRPERDVVTIENRFETASGTRWTLWRNHGLLFDADGNWLEAQSSGFDITERKALEEQRQLLIDELNHRVRNTLMVVQGMAYQSFRSDTVPPQALAAFNARLHALASAHTVLSRANWVGAEVGEVVRHGLEICGEDLARVSISGPLANLRPNAAVALVLVLHELATNAVKYGALSNHGGTVAIGWTLQNGRLSICWTERGGPPVSVPTHRGFGSRLIATSVTRQLAGELEHDFAPEGLVCRMAFALEEAA